MKRKVGFVVLLVAVSVLRLGSAQAPAGAPAGATGLCNDGTYSTAASKSGACRGHKGIKTWFVAPDSIKAKASAASSTAPPAAASSAPAPQTVPTKAATTAPTPAPKSATSTVAQAPGGGAGQVWLNTASNVYHCQGTKYYGKTKAGAYMTEDEAKAKGAHPDHGKSCK